MATEETSQPDTISKERYDAVVRERDTLKQQTQEATNALSDYQKRDTARRALKNKVADPDTVADLITPFLSDVDTDDVADHVTSDAFAPRLSAFQPAQTETRTASSGEGDGEGDGEGESSSTPAVEQPGAFGGPSPGGTSGTKNAETLEKITTSSQEYQDAIRNNDVDRLEKWEKDGRLVSPARPWT